jgi:site-specific recombinase XerD
LADTGIRVGELAGLRPPDLIVQGRNQYLKVQGKGARERLVPVPPGLFRRLQRYADRSRPKDTHSDRLFLSLRRSTNGDYEPLTASGVGQLLKVLTEVAGVKKRVYPHLMRHSFATWTLTRGINPLTLAQILGHSSLAMIQNVYAHLTPSDSYDALLKVFSSDKQ